MQLNELCRCTCFAVENDKMNTHTLSHIKITDLNSETSRGNAAAAASASRDLLSLTDRVLAVEKRPTGVATGTLERLEAKIMVQVSIFCLYSLFVVFFYLARIH
jgi:hypothetical protein